MSDENKTCYSVKLLKLLLFLFRWHGSYMRYMIIFFFRYDLFYDLSISI